MEIFESLDSPSLEEMNGEYEATLLGQGGFLRNTVYQRNSRGLDTIDSFAFYEDRSHETLQDPLPD